MIAENEIFKENRYRETLAALEATMQRSTNAYETTSLALNAVVKALCAEAGTFWYYDRFNRGYIVPRATYGGMVLDKDFLSLGEGVAGKVIESGEPAVIPDCQSDPRWAGKVDARTGFTTKSMLCVPLAVQSAVFGCIQIINKKDNSPYDDEDLKLVTELAQDISALFRRYGLLNQFRTGTPHRTKRPPTGSKRSR